MADSNRRGFWAQVFWLMLSFALMGNGCRNAKVKSANEAVHKTSIEWLVTKPNETSLWVEINGLVPPGSTFKEESTSYGILLEPSTKTAAVVRLADGSPMNGAPLAPVIVRGMVQPSGLKQSPPRGSLAPDIKLGNFIIAEKETPPGWWSSEFLMILGFIFLGGASPKKD